MQLKKVSEADRNTGGGGGGGGGISDLLSEIQKGRNLKSVSDEDRQSANPAQLEGMAGALAAALAERGKHIQVDDSDEDNNSDFDDDDWDDDD